MNQPICLFDSGIGGLTVFKKLLNRFPNENYIYLADLARVPYGDRTKDDIENIVSEIIEWLLKFNPKLIVMACNTSSSTVLDDYKKKLNLPVYGTIESCSKEIALSNLKKVTVWATKATTDSNAYKNKIQKVNSNIIVEEIPCPKLVPMIEDLNFIAPEKENIIREYLEITSNDSDVLVLGCTHYPLIQNDLVRLSNIKIIDPADALINELDKLLSSSTKKTDITEANHKISLYTTAQTEKLQRFARLYLCGDYKVNTISLSKLTNKIFHLC